MNNLIYANTPKFILWLIIIAAVIAALVIMIIIATKHINEKKKRDCFNLLNKICLSANLDNYVLESVHNNTYDYYLETDSKKFYIKLINNPANQEICVNNAIKWQLRRNAFDKEVKFLDGVENLMRMDLKNDEKTNHKIFIIFPNAGVLLKVINECEMVFITPHTDIYGARIITYKQLLEDNTLLEL